MADLLRDDSSLPRTSLRRTALGLIYLAMEMVMLVSSAENGLKSAAGYMSSSWISGSFFPPLVSATRDLQHRRRLHSVAEYDIDPGQVLDCVQAFTIPDPASRSPTSLCVPRLFPDLLAKSPQPAILAARRSDIEERLLWDLVDVVWIMESEVNGQLLLNGGGAGLKRLGNRSAVLIAATQEERAEVVIIELLESDQRVFA
ncbi:hypothetical protein V8E53_002923 [Lactarius tabidus]